MKIPILNLLGLRTEKRGATSPQVVAVHPPHQASALPRKDRAIRNMAIVPVGVKLQIPDTFEKTCTECGAAKDFPQQVNVAVQKTLQHLGIPIEPSPSEKTPKITIILGKEQTNIFTQIQYDPSNGTSPKNSSPIKVPHAVVFLPSMPTNVKKIERIVVSALNQIKRAVRKEQADNKVTTTG